MPQTALRSNGYAHHYAQNGHAKTNGHGGEFAIIPTTRAWKMQNTNISH